MCSGKVLRLILELGSRDAAKVGRVLRNLAADMVARTCLSETFLSESQASLGCTMKPRLKKNRANPDVGCTCCNPNP